MSVWTDGDEDRLRRAAEMGFAYAQAEVFWLEETTAEEMFALALRASLQGEREGFYSLGFSYQYALGCERDVIKARENYRLAAELTHVDAMIRCGQLLKGKDPQRWHWWGLAASRGETSSLISNFGEQVDHFSSDLSLAPVVFMIGRMLKGGIDLEKKTFFGYIDYDFVSRIGPANRAVAFFSLQCAAARAAVDTWCLIARRFFASQVNRDIRKKIGMLIWEARELGNYKECVELPV